MAHSDKQHSKYINFYQQIDSLAFDDIDIKINIYPTYNISRFHIIIISKEGYGTHEYVTSSKIVTCFPISDNELNIYITNARCFFNKTKQLLQNYVRKSQ
jgi:hypothetical protein